MTAWFVLAGVAAGAGQFLVAVALGAGTVGAALATVVASISLLLTIGAGGAGIIAAHQRRNDTESGRELEHVLREAPRISERAAATERARISRILHDDLGHNLALINLFVSSIETADLTEEEVREALATIREQNHAASQALVQALDGLRGQPPAASFGDRLEELTGDVERAGLRIETDLPSDLSVGVGDAALVLRTIREGLTNAVKYAHPARARVAISVDGRTSTTTVTITNPVPRDARQGPRTSSGSGIRRLREDASAIGATVSFVIDDDRARLSLVLPSVRAS
ncbi:MULTISPECIES: sensor histidine kinase [Microbacterium]|uniref:sensor histidine kinase n=1 Tax=Microbacterium TaxID=33882 RepID=UPI00277DDD56|nr:MULTISPECIES: histidine kinase [Microbacterium]MDQ1082290.1 signal transduction histidine kinase [Microbacterium sp. SORGH_AS_0344]MDQ1168938.1 signal transduction histidine kinase [Microbacterium proteolyticum]